MNTSNKRKHYSIELNLRQRQLARRRTNKPKRWPWGSRSLFSRFCVRIWPGCTAWDFSRTNVLIPTYGTALGVFLSRKYKFAHSIRSRSFLLKSDDLKLLQQIDIKTSEGSIVEEVNDFLHLGFFLKLLKSSRQRWYI